jgi:hypothetical protein
VLRNVLIDHYSVERCVLMADAQEALAEVHRRGPVDTIWVADGSKAYRKKGSAVRSVRSSPRLQLLCLCRLLEIWLSIGGGSVHAQARAAH